MFRNVPHGFLKAKISSCLTTALSMRDKMLEKVSEFKYLGVILSEDMLIA